MQAYFIRRFLLIIPTFIGITLLSFVIMQFVPGGPVDRAIMQYKMGAISQGEGGTTGGGSEASSMEIPAEALEEMKRFYGFDKPVHVRYLLWLYNIQPFKYDDRLFVAPLDRASNAITTATVTGRQQALKELETARAENTLAREKLEAAVLRLQSKLAHYEEIQPMLETARGTCPAAADALEAAKSAVTGNQDVAAQDLTLANAMEAIRTEKDRLDLAADRINRDLITLGETTIPTVRTQASFYTLVDFGNSYTQGKPVLDLIISKFPVSIYFGLIGFFLSYAICVPLGIWKAVKHNSTFDAVSSMTVFIGYSVPGWALGVILLVLFGGGTSWELFPLGGFRSANWDQLSMAGKVIDQLHHTILPVFCYMIGSFATLTVLMKNSLMENLGTDYVRTAFAKGLDEKVVIFKHALRNSLIPIATGLGHALSLVLAGSYLIEKVFNIDGFGFLGYTSIVERDYPVAMGILVIGSLLKLFGNIFSDILYCLIDPRIRFE